MQEWSLLSEESHHSWGDALQALRARLDPASKVMATQDFRHLSQREMESAADYIWRLEQSFRVAYGRDSMLTETREALLHGQLQGGLSYELMKSPAVSGAQGYKELCIAAI